MSDTQKRNKATSAGRMRRLVLWLLRMLPDWEWKRELCGGVWIYYQTSLPMAPVWLQCPDGKSTPPRQACEISRIKTERRGKIRHALYPENDQGHAAARSGPKTN